MMRDLWRAFAQGGGLQADTQAGQAWFVRAEALSLWTRGNPTPALLTTSPLGTPQTAAGVLGQPGTTTLFGNQLLDNGARGAGRITFGHWLDDMKLRGIEGHYLALGQGATSYANSQDFDVNPNAQILARPFYNVDPSLPHARQDSLVLAYPNFDLLGTPVQLNGTFNVQTTSTMQSAGALYRRMLWMNYDAGYRLDLVGGYRFFRVDDSVSINDSTTTAGGLLANTTFTAFDQFSARNQFQGGELGLNGQYYWGRLSLDGLAKLALGNVHESVNINGQSTVTTLGTTITTPGGLLAQPSNMGYYSRNRFGVLPEAQLNLRYDLTRRVRLTVGYTFMYLNRAQHSGTAMDNAVNPTQIGGTLNGPARPAFVWNDSVGYWAQGISTGVEYRW
jgi:hypothetical protein